MPVNQIIYNGKEFSGDYTYIKDDKKFQIDFLLTSANGREYIEDFQIIENNWHVSDHRLVTLSLLISKNVNINSILPLAIELYDNNEKNSTVITITNPLNNILFNIVTLYNTP